MEFPLVLLLALLSVALGLAAGRYAFPARRGEDQATLARVEQESTSLRERLLHADGQRDALVIDLRAREVDLATLKERETSSQQKIETLTRQVAEQNKQLTAEFENIANRILKTNASEWSNASQRSLDAILDPLKERIKAFQDRVEHTHSEESRDVISLKAQIQAVMATSTAVGNQADSLAKVLRGDSRVLGRWGELALDRILTSAGLVKGREYINQGQGLELRNEEGEVQKPDVVVKLPEDRTLVIDSKVSLASYERLIAAKDDDERNLHSTQFLRDVKVHISDLSGKRYQENDKLRAHDCVLMFVPIEGALAAALNIDPELWAYAWDKRVVLVGPSALLMTMRTVESIWRYEQQSLNAQEIAKLAGDLCDKVSLSLADFSGAADKLRAALESHNEAVRRLSTGRGGVLFLGDKMKELGVATRRPTPQVRIDGVPVQAGSLDLDDE